MSEFKNKINTFFVTSDVDSKEPVQKLEVSASVPVTGKLYFFVAFFNLTIETDDLYTKIFVHTPDKTYTSNDYFSLNNFIDSSHNLHLTLNQVEFKTIGDIDATITLYKKDDGLDNPFVEIDKSITYCRFIGEKTNE